MNPRNPWTLTWLLAALAWVVSAEVFGASPMLVEGRTQLIMYRRGSEKPASEQLSWFRLEWHGANWKLKIIKDRSPWDYCELGSEGANIFTVINTAKANLMSEASGNAPASNKMAGQVSAGPTPHVYWAPECGLLWYLYVAPVPKSGAFVEPPYFPMVQDRMLHWRGFTQSVDVVKLPEPPYRAKSIAFQDDGWVRSWKETWHNDFIEPTLTKWEAPYHTGFTSAKLNVSSTRAVSGLTWPMEATWQFFLPAREGTTTNDLSVVHQFNIIATNITVATPPTEWLPKLEGLVPIGDERFAREPVPLTHLDYIVTNRWLSDKEVRNLDVYEQAVKVHKASAPAAIAEAKLDRSGLRWIALAVLGVVSALVARQFLARQAPAREK